MSRPGAWARVFTNIKKYLKNDFSEKKYVAKDALGNHYYEIRNSRQNGTAEPGIEWQSWLRGTRRFPPAEEEIALNQARQQAQIGEDSATEKRAPHVQSKGKGANEGPRSYPKYKDLEVNPGAPPPPSNKQ